MKERRYNQCRNQMGTRKNRRRPVQLELRDTREKPTHGGKRKGAGRKPTGIVSHAARPRLAARFPVHVTLKLAPELPSLREGPLLPVVEACLSKVKEQKRFRLVHYSIQDHHLHLIVEAADARSLSLAIQGLAVRIARGANRGHARRGRVVSDRFFSRILKTPREVRNCIAYVINNRRRHLAHRGEHLAQDCVDELSSGRYFDGWRGRLQEALIDAAAMVAAPGTWLLSRGWRRWGLLRVDEVPGP